ncbi:MAG TPA: EF-hand domain-containing protein [Blastocatellia bacterium]|jgi:Ca2+-binding EF-hand superfamily protein|nr:EF-hand domain-containing protein [Blastocatellia bacterium]
MKKLFRAVNFLLVFAAGVAIASAQETPPQGPGGPPPGASSGRFQMPSFDDMDKNKDKKLSRDEFPSRMPSQYFDRIDENKDGFIDAEEWSRARGRTGSTQRFSDTLAKFMDSNADAKVSREEFARITQIFDALDKDKSGDLSQEELGRFFQAISEAQAQATGGVEVNNLFEKYDKNKDGKITAEEMGNERTFTALDLSKDGSVTKEEAEQALKQLASRSRQQKPQQ